MRRRSHSNAVKRKASMPADMDDDASDSGSQPDGRGSGYSTNPEAVRKRLQREYKKLNSTKKEIEEAKKAAREASAAHQARKKEECVLRPFLLCFSTNTFTGPIHHLLHYLLLRSD